jgi:hypothetical protein
VECVARQRLAGSEARRSSGGIDVDITEFDIAASTIRPSVSAKVGALLQDGAREGIPAKLVSGWHRPGVACRSTNCRIDRSRFTPQPLHKSEASGELGLSLWSMSEASMDGRKI